MKLDDLEVVVAGAAIGGAAVALLLAEAGANVLLVERVAEPKAVGAAILLQPNGLGVLYGLGLEPTLRAQGVELREGSIVDAASRAILAAPVPDFGSGLDHALVIRRSDLLAALLERVAAHPRIATRFGTTVTAATVNGHVTLDAAGRPDTLVADLVIAADGVHSALRDGGRFDARLTPGVEYVRALGPHRPLPAIMEYWTSCGLFGAASLRDATYFYASCGAPALADAVARRDLSAFRTAWAAALPLAGELLSQLSSFDQLLVNRVERVDCRRFADGRLVLLGDAAHAMSPNLGQGANSALVDAAVLTDALRRAPELGSALLTYDARRRPAVRTIQDTADRLARICEWRAPLAQGLRNRAVRLLGQIAGGDHAARAAQQEDPNWLRRVATGAVI